MKFQSFKTWLEEVKLLKDYDNPTYLGKFAWWDVYDATKRQDLNKASNLASYKTLFQEASHKLAALGFKRMNQRLIIIDGEGLEPNWVTGGTTGGFASRDRHGMALDKNHVNLESIIHEHAHMHWFNLPKHNKEFFQNYYEKITKLENFPKNLLFDLEYNLKDIKKKFKDKSQELTKLTTEFFLQKFKEKFNDLELKFKNYSDASPEFILLSSMKPGDIWVIDLKQDLEMQQEYWKGRKKTFPAHTKAELLKRYEDPQYIFEIRKGAYGYNKDLDSNYETDFKSQKEIENYIDIDTQENQERLSKIQYFIGSDFYQILAGKENLSDVYDMLKESLVSAYRSIFRSREMDAFALDRVFGHFNRYINSWQSYIRNRNKKITSIEDLEKLITDFLNDKILKFADFNMNQNYTPKPDVVSANISYPQGKGLREYLASKGLIASSYGAANLDEIWATTVEYAALDRAVSRDLKKLIWQTLSGV